MYGAIEYISGGTTLIIKIQIPLLKNEGTEKMPLIEIPLI